MKAIDLFAGLGGWSAGAKMAGVDVLWAANHWPEAVRPSIENTRAVTAPVIATAAPSRWTVTVKAASLPAMIVLML